ncbi:hypothetical protein CFP65_0977 [Kitasatospora sp. MMS16-BH015]|uniref:DUF3040 domain-containing protein n=1 Tax=Kitasatospora sp. MMS16-BH015 TaxID=2018025 RepID=UPI000CA1CA8B|nr:DUF3040 domain-containing protein [Kitasatospora sp. MMS16-BH015]AUG75896.1 hypothetical protein CFP65_0977 [Kitasatospora sp. MMS16-BH015]
MTTSLTAREQRALDAIEAQLRQDDAGLERLLAARPSPWTRLWHRPRVLAALVAALATLTAAGALCAGAYPAAAPLAAAGAGASALLCGLVFRHLARMRMT